MNKLTERIPRGISRPVTVKEFNAALDHLDKEIEKSNNEGLKEKIEKVLNIVLELHKENIQEVKNLKEQIKLINDKVNE